MTKVEEYTATDLAALFEHDDVCWEKVPGGSLIPTDVLRRAAHVLRELQAMADELRRLKEASLGDCEFCGDPAVRIETFDRDVPVCDACSAK